MEDNLKHKKLKLGDLLEKAIKTVVPSLAAAAERNGCNCKKRKEMLNELGDSLGITK